MANWSAVTCFITIIITLLSLPGVTGACMSMAAVIYAVGLTLEVLRLVGRGQVRG